VPFVLGGEPAMATPTAFTAALVALALLLAAGQAMRRRRARAWTVALEWTCLVGSLLLLVLPIGAPHGKRRIRPRAVDRMTRPRTNGT
jgi:hypothetical protein